MEPDVIYIYTHMVLVCLASTRLPEGKKVVRHFHWCMCARFDTLLAAMAQLSMSEPFETPGFRLRGHVLFITQGTAVVRTTRSIFVNGALSMERKG